MTYIAVCIPSIGGSGKMLDDLIKVCLKERHVVYLAVYDNSDDATCHYHSAKHRAGLTIYQEFNEFGKDWSPKAHMAFLNDDIVMAPGTLDALANELEGNMGIGAISVGRETTEAVVHPRKVRYTSGTVRLGGLNSWAFMVRKGCYPWKGIDERFKVWCGDDALFWDIENKMAKKLAVLEGVTVEHRHSMTLNGIPNVGELQAADMRLWHSLGRP